MINNEFLRQKPLSNLLLDYQAKSNHVKLKNGEFTAKHGEQFIVTLHRSQGAGITFLYLKNRIRYKPLNRYAPFRVKKFGFFTKEMRERVKDIHIHPGVLESFYVVAFGSLDTLLVANCVDENTALLVKLTF